MRNLAQLSIERSRVTLGVLGAVLALGLAGYNSLARDSMPPNTVRRTTIVSAFPGAGPERVEQLVTDKVEKVAQELPELKEVASTSRTGLSIVSVSLNDDVSPDQLQSVWDRLRRKLDKMEDLPAGVVPDLNDEGVGDVYGIVLALTSDGFSYADMKLWADDLRNELIEIEQAAKVKIGGAQDERIFVEFDNARLREYDLSASQLQSAIGATNILSSGGEVNLGDERIVLEPTGSFNSLEDVRKTLVPVAGRSQLIFLEDVAEVRKGYIDPPSQLVRANGREALSIHVNLKAGANIVALGQEVDRVVARWEADLPVGLEVVRVASLDRYIDSKVGDFVVNLAQSIAIVLGVMLLFLGLRTGSVIASLIPTVTIMTFMLMDLLDVGLNQVTLAALIMSLGMMVDNAIVIAESIVVRMEAGASAKRAAIEACTELSTPLLVSTLTTSLAFLSFFLAESSMGDIVGPLFVVISLALLSSWLVALTVITSLSCLFLRVEAAAKPRLVDRAIAWLKRLYQSLILAALGKRALVVAALLALFVLALFALTSVPFVFFPDSDRNLVTVDLNLPPGTRIEKTAEIVDELGSFMASSMSGGEEEPGDVVGWSAYVGQGPESYDLGYSPDEANSSYAHLLVTTASADRNGDVIQRLDEFAFNAFPNADVKVGFLGAGPGGTPVEIRISGHDPGALSRIAEEVKLELASIPGTKNIRDDWGPKGKKLVVEIDQSRAQGAGVTSQDVATSLQTVLDGFNTGEYREEDRSVPILMRALSSQQQTLASLETSDIFVQNTGASVPLLQIAEIVPAWQYSTIKRLDLSRSVTISSELTEAGNAAEVVARITPFLEERVSQWPPGTDYELAGDAKSTAENMEAVIKYLPLSGGLIVLLLLLQLNSARKVLIVLLTVPLAVIGAIGGLVLFGEPFGFMPFLGLIALAGIVINNAIILLDRIRAEQEDPGQDGQQALVAACLHRFRPIVLATLTTVLGLLPLYLGGGEMWEGMAVEMMVGLLFGTVITLIFIPVVFSIFFGKELARAPSASSARRQSRPA